MKTIKPSLDWGEIKIWNFGGDGMKITQDCGGYQATEIDCSLSQTRQIAKYLTNLVKKQDSKKNKD